MREKNLKVKLQYVAVRGYHEGEWGMGLGAENTRNVNIQTN
jgi:hypothetical protein